jgi:hypothetical protein
MKENLEYRRDFILFTCVVGFIVGFFSVISDNLPYIRDGVTAIEFIVSYLAIMINSLPGWFMLAMFVGYLFSRSMKEAVLLGGIYTIGAITFYFVIGYFYEDAPVPMTFKEQIIMYTTWYGASAIGGMLGGSVGFLMKKTPYVLLSLVAGLILQLFVNGTRSWQDVVGISQNVTFCLLIVSVLLYLVFVKRKKTEKYVKSI